MHWSERRQEFRGLRAVIVTSSTKLQVFREKGTFAPSTTCSVVPQLSKKLQKKNAMGFDCLNCKKRVRLALLAGFCFCYQCYQYVTHGSGFLFHVSCLSISCTFFHPMGGRLYSVPAVALGVWFSMACGEAVLVLFCGCFNRAIQAKHEMDMGSCMDWRV